MIKNRLPRMLLVLAVLFLVVVEGGLPAKTFAADLTTVKPYLTIGGSETDQVHLVWTLAGKVKLSGFLVERSQQPQVGFTVIADVGRNDGELFDTEISPHADYFYRVRGYKNGRVIEYSEYSDPVLRDGSVSPSADVTEPSVGLTNPEDNALVSVAQSLELRAAAQDDTGIEQVEFYLNNVLLGRDAIPPFGAVWTVSREFNGGNRLKVKAIDLSGNTAYSNEITVTVDIPAAQLDVPPTVAIISPDSATVVTEPQRVTVVADAQDDQAVDYVEFYAGTERVKADGTPPYSFNWDVTASDNGSYLFTGVAYDSAGQTTTSATLTIFIDIPDGTVEPPPVERKQFSLRIDPAFNVADLPADARVWYARLWAMLDNPTQLPMHVDDMAISNDTYLYGRALNTHVTSLLQTLRVTGDPALLEEVDRIAELMRAQLRDWSITTYQGTTYEADGYLNWLYLYDPSYAGTDAHEMDDSLTHSAVAAMAYAFYVNRDLDPLYAERADFWTDYLQNHFEAKWRNRKGISSGFPFLTKRLAHVYAQWIRYHVYMYGLTGQAGYFDEAQRMAGLIDQHIFETNTPFGPAAQWYHGMPILGESELGIQRMSYARYTVQALADLAMEGFSPFSEPGFMEKIAVMLARFVMDEGAPDSFAYRIDGTSDPRETDARYSYSPYTQLGFWDNTGRILPVSEQVFFQLETAPEHPRRVFIPAGMFLSLMR